MQMRGDEGSLLFVLISLRLFPMTPNWLLNVASPLVGVPLPLFFLSVLIGKVGVASSMACVWGWLVRLAQRSFVHWQSIEPIFGVWYFACG